MLNAATGKIRNYQIIVSSVQMGIVFFSYLVVSITNNPILTMAVSNILYLLVFVPRILSNKPYVGITFGFYYKNVLQGILLMIITTTSLTLIPVLLMTDGWERLVVVGSVSTISSIVSSFIFVLSNGEKDKILGFVKRKIKK